MSRSTTGFVNWKTEDFTDLDYTAAAAGHAQQHRRGFPVHRGGAVLVRPRRRRSRCRRRCRSNGRPACSCSRRTTRRTPSTTTRRSCCRRLSPSRSASTRRSRRSTTAASASTGRGTFTVSRKLDLIVGVRGRSRAQGSRPADLLRPADCAAAAGRQSTSDFSDVVAAVRRRLPRGPGGDPVRARRRAASRPAASTRRRRPAPRPTARSTTGTTKAGVKSSALGGRLTGQRRGVPHRLERPAGERAEPAGAGAVLHRQRRGREEHGRRARAQRAAGIGAWTSLPASA